MNMSMYVSYLFIKSLKKEELTNKNKVKYFPMRTAHGKNISLKIKVWKMSANKTF